MTESAHPPVDDLTAPWWAATRDRILLLQRCGTCMAVQHYPRTVCTSCGATGGLGWIEATGRGTIDCFTVVHRAPGAGLAVPYVVARVRLAEGPVLLTNLTTIPEDHELDVELTWRPLADGRHLPIFAVRTGQAQERQGS